MQHLWDYFLDLRWQDCHFESQYDDILNAIIQSDPQKQISTTHINKYTMEKNKKTETATEKIEVKFDLMPIEDIMSICLAAVAELQHDLKRTRLPDVQRINEKRLQLWGSIAKYLDDIKNP